MTERAGRPASRLGWFPGRRLFRFARRWRSTPALVLVIVGLWGGCSVERHYAVLSVFFDGVPDPNAPKRPVRGTGEVAVGIVSSHLAFEERRCDECHAQTARFSFSVDGFTGLDGTVCLKCHAEVTSEHPDMHGPVVANACLWCHEAHESPFAHLLRTEGPEMCLSCHEFAEDVDARVPEHQDLTRDCLECHGAHGGNDQYFLNPVEPAMSEEATGPTSDEAGPAEQREQ
jgi:predicted CXXCH cytochrome family protein